MKQQMGIGCACLFLLPFACVGVGALGWAGWGVVDYWRMQSWDEVPATLVTLDKRHGDDTITIDASYTYEYQGQPHTGTRVGIYTGGDNIGSFQQRAFDQLSQAKQAGRTVPCFVNPSEPGESVLFRQFRPLMLLFQSMFGVIFGLIGIGGYAAMWYGSKYVKRDAAKAEQYPAEPWLRRDDWREGIIKPPMGSHLLGLGIFALFWNALSWPIFIVMMFDDRPQEWFVPWLVGLFPFIGTCFVAGLLLQYVRWRRFRGTYFRLASNPGVIGGRLAGVIVIPQTIRPTDGFLLTLKCVQQVDQGESQTNETIYEDEIRIGQTLDSSGAETSIPVVFTIPSSTLATDDAAHRKWQLHCWADLPGPNLDVTFDVPVFRTADSRDDVEADPTAHRLANFELAESLERQLARQKIRMTAGHDPNEIIFTTPPCRHLGTAIFFTLFTAIFGGVTIGMIFAQQWLFVAVFGFFSLFLIPLTLRTWLLQRRLTVVRDRWRIQSGWWPLWTSTQEFTSADITSFQTASNSSTNGKPWNRIEAKLRGIKKPVVLTHDLTSRRIEQAWLADLRQRAGLEESRSDSGELDLSEPTKSSGK